MVRKDTIGKMKGDPNGFVHGFRIVFLGHIRGEQGKLMEDEITETHWFTPEEIYAMDDSTLRDRDVKIMVRDYFAGKRFSLDVVTHTVRNE